MFKKELKIVFILAFVLLFRVFGISIIFPIFTNYLLTLKTVNKILISLTIGIYGFSQSFFQIPLGILSDFFGRKKVIIFGLCIFILGCLVVVIEKSIYGIMIGRFLQGSGAISSVILALASDSISEKNRTILMALIGIIFGISFSIGIAMSPIIYDLFGLNNVLFLISFFSFLSILMIFYYIPKDNPINMNFSFYIVKNVIKKILINKNILKLNCSIFLLHMLLMSNFIILFPIIKKFGISSIQQTKIYFFVLFFSLIISFILLYQFKPSKKILQNSIILLFISILFFLFYKQHIYFFLFGLQIFFIGFNIIESILPAILVRIASFPYKGTTMSLFLTSQFFGLGFGGIIFGYLYSIVDNLLLLLIIELIILILWFLIVFHLDDGLYLTNFNYLMKNKNINIDILIKDLMNIKGIKEVFLSKNKDVIYIKVNNLILSKNKVINFIDKY
ncbi:MAG: MFS transporter [Arsenophonus sp.]|nr:MAG: MFS transporter [Arsenophonus sp.]